MPLTFPPLASVVTPEFGIPLVELDAVLRRLR